METDPLDFSCTQGSSAVVEADQPGEPGLLWVAALGVRAADGLQYIPPDWAYAHPEMLRTWRQAYASAIERTSYMWHQHNRTREGIKERA